MNENIFEMPKFKGVNVSPKTVAILIAVGLGVLLLFSSFYQVDPEQVGVVLQFGKYNRTTNPGLHFKVPFVEDYILVPVQRQLKQEFGFRTLEASVRSRFARQEDESLMLTGDLNVAVVEWIVQYRVSETGTASTSRSGRQGCACSTCRCSRVERSIQTRPARWRSTCR